MEEIRQSVRASSDKLLTQLAQLSQHLDRFKSPQSLEEEMKDLTNEQKAELLILLTFAINTCSFGKDTFSFIRIGTHTVINITSPPQISGNLA